MKSPCFLCIESIIFPRMTASISIIRPIIKISLHLLPAASRFARYREYLSFEHYKRLIKRRRLGVPTWHVDRESSSSQCPLNFWQKTSEYRLTNFAVHTRRFPRVTVIVAHVLASCIFFYRNIPNCPRRINLLYPVSFSLPLALPFPVCITIGSCSTSTSNPARRIAPLRILSREFLFAGETPPMKYLHKCGKKNVVKSVIN